MVKLFFLVLSLINTIDGIEIPNEEFEIILKTLDNYKQELTSLKNALKTLESKVHDTRQNDVSFIIYDLNTIFFFCE